MTGYPPAKIGILAATDLLSTREEPLVVPLEHWEKSRTSYSLAATKWRSEFAGERATVDPLELWECTLLQTTYNYGVQGLRSTFGLERSRSGGCSRMMIPIDFTRVAGTYFHEPRVASLTAGVDVRIQVTVGLCQTSDFAT